MIKMITHKEVRKLLDYNFKTGILTWKVKRKGLQIGDIAGGLTTENYISITINRIQYQAHRIIWLWVKGYFPEHGIDHKDRIKYHNWWSNLRETSQQCNARNTGNRTDNKSGVKGICFNKKSGNWLVQIRMNGKNKYIGYFIDFDEAVCHRLAAEQCIGWEGCDSSSPAYQYVLINRYSC